MKKENMNWGTFKQHLLAVPGLILQFQYADDNWVDAAYHITEIKQAPITSVDCGGVLNAWTEVIVQLWEPQNETALTAMKVSKALAIIELVEKSLPLNPLAMLKIEFGNVDYDTRQLLPKGIVTDGDNLIFDLRPDAVQCKAIERGGSCATNEQGEECCAPATEPKPKIQLTNLAVYAPVCTPGSGCC